MVPGLWQAEDGAIIVTDWAAGFLDGVQLRPEAWAPLLEDAKASVFMVPIIAAGSDLTAAEAIGIGGEQDDALLDEAVEEIPVCVVAIERFWRERAGLDETKH